MRNFPTSLILALTFVITACSSAEITVVDRPATRFSHQDGVQTEQPRPQQTLLRIGETEAIFGLDPLFAETNAGKRLIGLMYQGLTGLNADGEVVPVLAQRWTVSDDSLVYTFHLNPEAAFRDSPRFIDGKGRFVVAADVKAAFERMALASVPAQAANLFSPIIQGMEVFVREQRELQIPEQRSMSGIQGIEIINERTVRFFLTEVTPEFTKLLTSPLASITPRELTSQLGTNPVGSGPFALADRRADTLFVLEYHPSYWLANAESYPARVEVRRYDSETTILNAMRRNLVDIAPNLSPLARMTALRKDGSLNTDILPEFNLFSVEGNDYLSLFHNTASRMNLTADEAGSILNALPADTLVARLSHLGLSEIRRGLVAPPDVYSTIRLRFSDDSQPRPTISFFLSNYEGFVARNSHQLAQPMFPLAMVRSGVVSREITWYLRYNANYKNQYIGRPLDENELLRFSLTRVGIVHNRIENFNVNEYGWWLSLRDVRLNTEL
ncbi:MAG: ABC transporter substrate-binding protein [Bacteroidetes bacterium]|nr:ABC transporter substrate-binding protein [Bacteroidota bacterium]MCH8523428.1 ABC transporter substrate-binding protein [Balneolales bacterium]